MDRTFIMEWLTIVVLSGSALGWLCNVWIVKPLTTAIDNLKEMLKQAQALLAKLEAEHHDLDKRLAVVENETERAHERISAVKTTLKMPISKECDRI